MERDSKREWPHHGGVGPGRASVGANAATTRGGNCGNHPAHSGALSRHTQLEELAARLALRGASHPGLWGIVMGAVEVTASGPRPGWGMGERSHERSGGTLTFKTLCCLSVEASSG